MDIILRHKLIVATIIIQIVALPLILFTVKQKQETTTKAAASTTLSFSPVSDANNPLNVAIGGTLPVDVMVDPGTNLISLAKIEVIYDSSRITLDPTTPIIVNNQVFPVTVEGPVLSQGKMQIVLSIGPDQTKVIQTPSKILTLRFRGVFTSSQSTNTNVTFGTNTALYSIAPTDTSTENVLQNTTQALIKVNPNPTSTPVPTSTPTPAPTATPTPTSSPTPTPTPTPSPAPTSTPTPVPTAVPTPAPQITVLNFTGLKLHGIGRGGDTPNPTSVGTLSPLRPTRALTVEIYNTSGTLVNTTTGNISYSGSATGVFGGNITIPNTVSSGNYLIKIKTPFYLRRQLTGFVSLAAGGTNQMALVSLIAGDVNNDNALSVADYDIIMDCYSDLMPAKNCNASKALTADISDDGKVDQDDYNLFLRELSTQQGD